MISDALSSTIQYTSNMTEIAKMARRNHVLEAYVKTKDEDKAVVSQFKKFPDANLWSCKALNYVLTSAYEVLSAYFLPSRNPLHKLLIASQISNGSSSAGITDFHEKEQTLIAHDDIPLCGFRRRPLVYQALASLPVLGPRGNDFPSTIPSSSASRLRFFVLTISFVAIAID
jgi:hypothetical protein